MRPTFFLKVFLQANLILFISGCFYSREIIQIKHDLEKQYPEATFDRELMLSFGPFSMQSIAWFSGFVGDENVEIARDYIHDIKRLKLGVFNVDHLPESGLDFSTMRRFNKENWQVAVKARQESSSAWVLYSEDHEVVRDMFIMVVDEEQLVLVRIQGYLSDLLRKAIQDQDQLFGISKRKNQKD